MSENLMRRRFIQTAALAAAGGSAMQAVRAQAVAGMTPTSTDMLNVGAGLAPATRAFVAPTRVGPLKIAALEDLEAEARKVMDPGAFAFIASGSDSQWTLRENRRAFQRVTVKPHYLVGQAQPDLRTSLLGHALSMPIITAPMGAHGLAHVSAESGTARGTAEAGTLMTVSTMANMPLELIAAAAPGPKWFQLYLLEDRAASKALIRRAEVAGYTAIVFSIDAFAPGSSDATIRMGFNFPPSLPIVNADPRQMKKSLGWDDLKFIQDSTRLPVVLKGVLTPETAKQALEHGVAAVQVSNHGGRQLDGVAAAFDALPGVVEAVGGRVPVIMDSGIRRGGDVFKALARGASAVAIGRPVLYSLALGGWMGVKSAYERIAAELSRDMLIAGAAGVKDIDRRFLIPSAGPAQG